MQKFLICFVALGTLVLIPGVASSQQPQRQPSSSGQPATPDQRGTDISPLIVKLAPTPESQTEATKRANEQQDQSSSNWWLVRATVLLAVIGLMQLGVFGLQARRLRQTVEKMDDTAVQELRAYISAQPNGPLQGLTAATAVHTPTLNMNHGRTPAYQVDVKAMLDVLPYPLPPDFPLPQVIVPRPSSKTVIHPQGGTAYGAFSTAPISGFQIGQIDAGTHRLYVFGRIDYVDAFSKERETTFCASATPPPAPTTFGNVHAGGGTLFVNWEYADQHNGAT
jgi:hypothetical protein